MYVPIIRTKTIVKNKAVVESDTVLSLNELGENLRISVLNNIEPYEIERCVKTILESNEKVMFHTIQYSKKEKKIYFYTNDLVNVDRWESRNFKDYQKMENKKEVIEEIKKLLAMPIIEHTDSTSLWAIKNLLKERNEQNDKRKREFDKRLETSVKEKINEDLLVFYIYNDNNEIKLCIKEKQKEWKAIYFQMDENDIVIKSSEINNPETYLLCFGKTLFDIFVFHTQVEKENGELKKSIPALNSNFCVDLFGYTVHFYLQSEKENVYKSFEYSIGEENRYRCNSYFLLSVLKEKEEEILKRIRISLNDCPNWLKSILLKKEQAKLKQMKCEMDRSFLQRIKKALFEKSE